MRELKWFPGHMKSALEDIEDNKIKLADVILYVIDSRAPMACMNPNIKKITHGKPIVYLFNKIDLADEKKIAAIRKTFTEEGKISITSSAKDMQSKIEIKDALRKVLKDKI